MKSAGALCRCFSPLIYLQKSLYWKQRKTNDVLWDDSIDKKTQTVVKSGKLRA